jgi:hypothetical protein
MHIKSHKQAAGHPPTRAMPWYHPLRIPTVLMVGLVQFYRHILSRLSPPTCIFTPSCSRYGLDSLKRYGVVRGTYLACWRVLRCNPFNKGGYDPLQ